MTKCPYVPPHPWNVDFPHLMLRAKAFKFANQPVRTRDRILSATDLVGSLAGIPVVAEIVNAVNKTAAGRKLLDKALGVHPDAPVPKYHSKSYRKQHAAAAHPAIDVQADGGHEGTRRAVRHLLRQSQRAGPGQGSHRDLRAQRHRRDDRCDPSTAAACRSWRSAISRPSRRLKEQNIPELARLVDEGWDIVTPVPSCTLMFKQELPLMFPDDAQVLKVRDAMFDPFEYLWARYKGGLLRTNFTRKLGKISYHVPCHLRVQNLGLKTRDVLMLVPETQVEPIERCSGSQRHLRREARVSRRVDEDRPSGRAPRRRQRRGLLFERLPDGRPPDRVRVLERAARADASAEAAAHGVRNLTVTAMHLPHLTRKDLMSLEQYSTARKDFRAKVIEHKRNRSVALGPNATWSFEDQLTMQYQVQEMLRVERIFEADAIQEELDAYNPLIPDGAQLEGDVPAGVSGRRRAPRAALAAEGRRGSLLGAGRGVRSRVGDRGRRPGARERRQDFLGALPALRAEPADVRAGEGGRGDRRRHRPRQLSPRGGEPAAKRARFAGETHESASTQTGGAVRIRARKFSSIARSR